MNLTVLERKKYNCLCEIMDTSQQMGEALDRNDPVSVRMLVALRQDPIRSLEEVRHAADLKLADLPPADRERVCDLNGGAPPKDEPETTYVNQAGSVRRLLERVVELDRRLNRRLAGSNSFYAKEE